MPDIYLQLMSKSPGEQAKPVEGERIRLEKIFEERSYHFPNLPAEDANGQKLEYSVVEQTVDENGNYQLANFDNYTTTVVQFPGEMESNIYNIYMPTLNGDRSSPCQLIWYAEAIINQRIYHHPLKLFTYSVNESHDTFTTPDGIEMQSGGRFEIQHWGNDNRAYWRIPITTRYPLKNAQLTFNFDAFNFPDYAPWKPVEGFLDNLFAPNTTEFLYRFTGGLAEGYETLPDLDLSNVTYVNDPDTGEHSLTINLGDMPAMKAYMIQINGVYDQSEGGDTGEILPSFITGAWLTADTRCLTGVKAWVGDPPPEGTNITLELVKNTAAGAEVVDVMLTYPDNQHTWGRLDWDADYTIRERDLPAGWVQYGDAELVQESEDGSKSFWAVTNIKATSVTATKTWVNGATPRPTVWFQLYRQLEGGAAEAVPGADIKELADGTTTVTWDNLAQTDKEGREYTFTVREVDQDGNDFAPENYVKSEAGLTVTNTYVIPKGQVTANKAWVNGPSPRPTVWFKLCRQVEGGVVEEVPLAQAPIKELADGTLSVTWTNLEQMDKDGKAYTFSVREVDKDGNDYTPANYRKSESGLTITNTYVIPKGQVTANKAWVNGPSPRPSVWFQLYRQIEGGAAEAVPGADIKELKDGTTSVSWDDLEQTDKDGKVYTFSVKEVDKDGNDLTLFNYTKVEDGLTVTNTFVPPEKTFADLTLKKELDGMDLTAGAFSFQLFGNDLSTALETKTNDADGTVTFRLQFDVEGPFVVHVKEVNAGKDGFTYDSSVYKLTYQVAVGADNKLQATLTEVLKDGRVVDKAAPLVFNNTYTAPTPTPSPTPTPTPTPSPTPSATPSPSPTPDPTKPPAPTYPTIKVPLAAKKELKNGSLKAGDFTFQLKDKAGKVLAEVTNGADGSVVFPTRTFSKEVSNYLYTITELAGENSKMKYDRTVYTIKVTTRAVAGELQATVQVEKDGVPFAGDMLFTNVLPAPPTGDAILNQLGLLLGLSLALLGGAYLIRKRRQNTN
jgi:pilin isopeptide linkage protein/LPXTG-motif cell wall-anchored protein